MTKIIITCNRIITYSFYLLFALVPLIFTRFNFELFEFNKMWATFILTVIIGASWLIKQVLEGKLKFQRTPLDIPILLFLAALILSTIFSIDVHTSIWGYYSRFNGGLLSIFSYIFLYYAFINNFTKENKLVPRLLMISLVTGALVALYGTLEHFGIDAQYWVQDVQNRVFSTLGQPNWLAAYLSILIPIALAFGMENLKHEARNSKPKINFGNLNFENLNLFRISIFGFSALLFYTTLLFTKSRSGFLGFGVGFLFFLTTYFWSNRQSFKDITLRGFIRLHWYLLVVLTTLSVVTFIVGTPFERLNQFTFERVRQQLPQLKTNDQRLTTKPQSPALETGGTESGEIRKIVWQGAIDIARAYPLFGSGVETFAFSYHKFKPVAHNLTSEWDFLYNKAHNEYLNYLANTGFFGLGAYLLMIGFFFKYVILSPPKGEGSQKILRFAQNDNLVIALLAAYISILVSNFFGFSVVIINLYFFLIPAFIFILSDQINPKKTITFSLPPNIQNVLILVVIFISSYLLFNLAKFWLADTNYATGYNLGRAGEFDKSYQYLAQAVDLRGDEPVFKDELAVHTAVLATVFYTQDQATVAAQLTNQAINLSNEVNKKHPQNASFWKNQARLFYTLSGMEEKYLLEAIVALERARLLAPTDPKIFYNLALLYGQANPPVGGPEQAIENLEETVKLKPNYRDAYYALGLFYEEVGERKKAIEQMEHILKNIASSDAQATQALLEWRGY